MMCLLQILLVSVAVYLVARVNFIPTDQYKQRIADCFFAKDNILKSLIRGRLKTSFSSLFIAISFVWVLFNAFASGEKLTLFYFFAVAAATVWIVSKKMERFKKETHEEVVNYCSLEHIPLLVTLFSVIPYAVIFYFTVPVKELVPTADPVRYFNSLFERYDYLHCLLFKHLAIWGDFFNYLVWSFVLSLSKLSGQFFLFATFFLLIKGGFSAWVVAKTSLAAWITWKTSKRKK